MRPHPHSTATRARARADTPRFSRHPGIRPAALTTLTRIHLKTFILPFFFCFLGISFFFSPSPVSRVAQQARGRGAGFDLALPTRGNLSSFPPSLFPQATSALPFPVVRGRGRGTDPQTHNASLQERRRARGKGGGGGKKKQPTVRGTLGRENGPREHAAL